MLLEKIVILQLSFSILQNMALNINLKEAGVDTDEIICRTYLLFFLSYVESLIRLSKNSRNGNADKQCVKKLNAWGGLCPDFGNSSSLSGCPEDVSKY